MIRIFRVFVPTSILALLASEGCLIFGCFFLPAYLDPDIDPEMFMAYDWAPCGSRSYRG